MDQLMNVNDWYLFQGVGNVIAFQRIVGPKLLGITPDEAAIAAALPKAEQVFKELERQLAGRDFFVADSLTLADVLLVPQLDFLSLTPEWSNLTADKPRVCRWLHQMNARASLIATTWEKVADLARNA
jgi:glutathione S-transferase